MEFVVQNLPFYLFIFLVSAAFFGFYMVTKSIYEVSLQNELMEAALNRRRTIIKKSPFYGRHDKPTSKKRPYKPKEKDAFRHSWLMTTLRGHSNTIYDMSFSPNGRFLASCGEDGAILLWDPKDWLKKVHRNVRVNVKYDYATMIRWSPDSRAFVIKREKDNVIEGYKISEDKNGIRNIFPFITYPRFFADSIIGLGLSANGKYLMTSSNNTEIVISDLKGTVMARFNSYVALNYSTYLSPCGKLVIASGFVPDARIWHVEFAKSTEFKGCKRLYDLKGHSASVQDTACDATSSKIATVSKDGTWKLFDVSGIINQQEPVVLGYGTYERDEISKIALSPNADVIAVTSGSDLYVYDAKSAKLDIVINDVFPGTINKVLFDPEGKFILICGDKYVRIFHNITGIKASAEANRIKLRQRNNTSDVKERLRLEISNAEAFLASYTV